MSVYLGCNYCEVSICGAGTGETCHMYQQIIVN